MFAHRTAGTEQDVDGVNTIDVNNGESTTAFGVCAWILMMSELNLVTGLLKATILEKRSSPYLESVSH